jgi:hypothetical protein
MTSGNQPLAGRAASMGAAGEGLQRLSEKESKEVRKKENNFMNRY